MKALLSLALLLVLHLVGPRFAAAQFLIRDAEPAAPRVSPELPYTPLAADPAIGARRDELVRYFTRTLALQPHQAQAVRRALALTIMQQLPEADATAQDVSPIDEVRLLLSEKQLAVLAQLEASPVPAPELKWLAVAR